MKDVDTKLTMFGKTIDTATLTYQQKSFLRLLMKILSLGILWGAIGFWGMFGVLLMVTFYTLELDGDE